MPLFLAALFSQGEDLLGDVDSESVTEPVPAEDKEQDDACVSFQPWRDQQSKHEPGGSHPESCNRHLSHQSRMIPFTFTGTEDFPSIKQGEDASCPLKRRDSSDGDGVQSGTI